MELSTESIQSISSSPSHYQSKSISAIRILKRQQGADHSTKSPDKKAGGEISIDESWGAVPGYLSDNTTTEKTNLVLIQQPIGPLRTTTTSTSAATGGDDSQVTTTITTAANCETISNAVNTGVISSKVPSISIFPLPPNTTVRTISTANKATSPPLTFITTTAGTKTATLVRSVPSLVLQQQRPQQQHQYQQTDKCTILKFDVVRKTSSLSTSTTNSSSTPTNAIIAASASPSSTETTLMIPSNAVHIDSNDLEELEEVSKQQYSQHHSQQQQSHIISNQPIIVKIEPTQAFHIVDENDTRVLSLPLTDNDKVGASWIDLKDIASLQTSSGTTLLDVCFEPVTTLTNTSVTTAESMTIDIPTEIVIKRQTLNKNTQSTMSSTATTTTTAATKAVATVTSAASTSREQYTGPSTSGAMTG